MVWTFVGSKKKPRWLWLAWSYQTTQTLSWAIGGRDERTGRQVLRAIPASYARKQIFTDGYGVYEWLIPWSRHCIHACMNWVCPKGSGDTNIAEGCNVYLRHRVSYLVRKSPSFARSLEWLSRHLLLVLFNRNQRIKKQRTQQLK